MSDKDINVSDSIWDQLMETPAVVTPTHNTRADEPPLTSENAEAFILKNAQTLINNSIESMESIKELVQNSPTPEEAEALARLIEATSTALDTVNKILIADKRNATLIKTKQMEIDSRQAAFETAVGARLMIGREELIARLALNSQAAHNTLKDAPKTIDAEIITTN